MLLVILIFLQDWRATLVPATTVPVTLIGTFAAMAALGFTVNLSTLFAIVLAIGIVVDDAIVIVEGVTHHIERGLSPREAAEKAMEELFGPIIGITLVLMSVFVPAAFLPGLTGQLFRQFALVIAATALISAINAATLKPTQCALWLRRPTPPERRNVVYRAFNRVYGGAERLYVALIARMLRASAATVAIALVLIGLAGWGLTRLPTAFLPTEDQGYVLIGAQLPDGASKERTDAVMQRIIALARGTPGVETVLAISGVSALDNNASLTNAGVAYVVLKDWDARAKQPGQDLRSLYDRLNASLAGIDGAATIVLVPPPIQGIGNASGFTMQVELRDGNFDYTLLERLARRIVADAGTQSGLQRLNTSFRAGVPQLSVVVDRVKAEALGVTVGQVFSTLSGYVGSSYVTQFNKFGRTFQVYLQAAPESRLRPEDIDGLKVRAGNGAMVPLGTLVEVRTVVGPSLIGLYNLYPSATIVGAASPGFSSGQALDLMEQVAERDLPRGTGFDWTAMSYQEKAVGAQIYLVFGLAILLVYLVLAGQYESWILPLAVLLAVPLALLGTAGTLLGLHVANNLYTQIGLILLIALSSKNAILIVEYARERRIAGMAITEAALEAARMRFRPILMTSFAFILGVVPLVTASGAGAAARKSIGIAVFSGMIASTCLAVLFVPSFYVVLQRFEDGAGAVAWRRPRGAPTGPEPRGAPGPNEAGHLGPPPGSVGPSPHQFPAVAEVRGGNRDGYGSANSIGMMESRRIAQGGEKPAKAGLAEREGFEPSIRLPVYTRSRRAPSTTRPPLRPALARAGIGEWRRVAGPRAGRKRGSRPSGPVGAGRGRGRRAGSRRMTPASFAAVHQGSRQRPDPVLKGRGSKTSQGSRCSAASTSGSSRSPRVPPPPTRSGAVSFAESSFFPVPPDVMMVPMMVSRPDRAYRYALIATLTSVVGGLVGYAIGALLYDSVGSWLFRLYGLDKGAETFREAYAHYGHWVILLKGFTPIPYKLVTITSGFAGYDLFWFVVLSLITRGRGSTCSPSWSAATA